MTHNTKNKKHFQTHKNKNILDRNSMKWCIKFMIKLVLLLSLLPLVVMMMMMIVDRDNYDLEEMRRKMQKIYKCTKSGYWADKYRWYCFITQNSIVHQKLSQKHQGDGHTHHIYFILSIIFKYLFNIKVRRFSYLVCFIAKKRFLTYIFLYNIC